MEGERGLLTLHKAVHQCRELDQFVRSDAARQRKNIETATRELLWTLRSRAFRYMHYAALTGANIQDFLQSRVYKREGIPSGSVPSVAPLPSSQAVRVINFMRMFATHVPHMLTCADWFFSLGFPKPPSCPVERSVVFFVASALPAVFAYGWCVEQGVAYVDAVVHLLRLQFARHGGADAVYGANSYIRELIRHFLLHLGISGYLSRALRRVYRDMVLETGVPTPQAVSRFACQCVQALLVNVDEIPSLVRYFFVQANAAGGAGVVEWIFVEFMLRSALVQPVLYGVSRGEFSPPLRAELAQFVTNVAREAPTVAKFRLLVDALCGWKGVVEGLRSARIQDATGLRFHYLLLSVNDLLFWRDMILATAEQVGGDAVALKDAVQFSAPADAPVLCDFFAQLFRLPNVTGPLEELQPDPEFKLELFQRPARPFAKEDKPAAVRFAHYLEGLRIDEAAPRDVPGFIEYQLERARRSHSVEWMTRTLSVRDNAVNGEILEKTFAYIMHEFVTIEQGLKVNVVLSRCNRDVNEALRRAREVWSDLTPLFHEALVENVAAPRLDEMSRDKTQLFLDPTAWPVLFAGLCKRVFCMAEEAKMVESEHRVGLIRQLHSYASRRLTLGDFRGIEPAFVAADEEVKARKEAICAEICLHLSAEAVRVAARPEFGALARDLGRSLGWQTALAILAETREAAEALRSAWRLETDAALDDVMFDQLFKLVLVRGQCHPLSTARYLLAVADWQGGVVVLDEEEQLSLDLWERLATEIGRAAL